MKRKLLSILLILVMVAALLPTVLAEKGITWKLEDGVLRFEGDGVMPSFLAIPKRDLSIEAFLNAKYPWDNSKNEIHSIYISAGLVNFDTYLVSKLPNLQEFQVAEGSKMYSSQEGVLMDRSGTILIRYPKNREGKSYILPENVADVYEEAFLDCSKLTHIAIPESVTDLDMTFLDYLTNLCEIQVAEQNPYYTSQDGILLYKDGTQIVRYPRKHKGESYTIPAGVTGIGSNAFYNCDQLTSIVIPESVTVIQRNAFSGCTGLTGVVIPEHVSKIRERAFFGCTKLVNITFPESVTNIGNEAFANCKAMQRIEFLGDAPAISGSAFEGVSAQARYPSNRSWPDGRRKNYGGHILWSEVTIEVPTDPIDFWTMPYSYEL